MNDLYELDRVKACACVDDCDTCWFLLSDEAFNEWGDDVIAVKLRRHLASGHRLTSEES